MTRGGIFWLSVAARLHTVTAAHNQHYQLIDHAICQRAKTKITEQAAFLLVSSCTLFTKRGWVKHLPRLSDVEIYLLWEIHMYNIYVHIRGSHLLAVARFNCLYKRDSERISLLFKPMCRFKSFIEKRRVHCNYLYIRGLKKSLILTQLLAVCNYCPSRFLRETCR